MKNFLITLTIVSSSLALLAHGVCISEEDGSVYLKLLRSEIDVTVHNQIATVTSLQTFYNDGSEDTKVKYGFPLPNSANPIYFRYRIEGSEWTEAVFNSAGQDTSIPTIGNTGGGSGGSGGTVSSSLKEYLGETPFFFTFANEIPNAKIVEVEIIYVQLLEYEFGTVQFHYPNDYSSIQSNIDVFKFNMELHSLREISTFELMSYQPEYDIQSNLSTLSLEDENTNIETDIVVNYSLVSDDLGSYTMSTMLPDSAAVCDDHGSGFLTMILEPESNENTEIIQKNFCLVIDRSGSMAGTKIGQAKAAASFIVNNLNEGDFFNIIEFSSTSTSFKKSMVAVDKESIESADAFIGDIYAGGTTNISGSLTDAIGNFGGLDPNKANIIIFFTDGKPTAGLEEVPEIISVIDNTVNSLETGIFLFNFGIGEDINKSLLTTLSVENGGIATFLQNDELEEVITDFFLRINNPVLLNTEVSFSPDIITDLYPSPLPNLYEGQQLILSGRYKQALPLEMTLKGQFYNTAVEHTFQIDLLDTLNSQFSVLPQIWAKQKVDDLSIGYNLTTSTIEQDLIQDEIDKIGSCYGVVNVAFNSFTDSVLEIDYQEFNLYEQSDNSVLVSWVTTAEINNEKFIVQRSCDTENWTDIYEEAGQTDSHQHNYYKYLDQQPCIGVNYYRLATIDLLGNISYSEVKAILLDQQEEVAVFPNPVNADDKLYINSTIEAELQVRIYSVDGRLLSDTEINGHASIKLIGYNPGIYYCIVSNKEFRKVVQLVVK